jgi:hypothetical protein
LANLTRQITRGFGTFKNEGAVKFKCFVFLICLLLFVAAIDTIPDPPAVGPRGSDRSGISAFHVRGSFTLPEKERFIASASIRHASAAWLAFRLDFDSVLVDNCPLALVRRAADSSPPLFS